MPSEKEIRTKLDAFLSAEQEPSLEGWIAMGIALLLKKHDTIPLKIVPYEVIDVVSDIIAFQEKFKQGYSGPPRQLPPEYSWRIDFFEEESIREYKEAVAAGDLVKQYDALLDTMFITLGTMIIQGFPIAAGWRELCRSNMSKECRPWGEGKFGSTVVKGKDFSPVRLESILYPLIDPEWIPERQEGDTDWWPDDYSEGRIGDFGQLIKNDE